jgi:hypothetical protein
MYRGLHQFITAWHTACFFGEPYFPAAIIPGGRESGTTYNPREKYEMPHFLARWRSLGGRLKISS